jgi:hypothetical protein
MRLVRRTMRLFRHMRAIRLAVPSQASHRARGPITKTASSSTPYATASIGPWSAGILPACDWSAGHSYGFGPYLSKRTRHKSQIANHKSQIAARLEPRVPSTNRKSPIAGAAGATRTNRKFGVKPLTAQSEVFSTSRPQTHMKHATMRVSAVGIGLEVIPCG